MPLPLRGETIGVEIVAWRIPGSLAALQIHQ
jgi:hypothetical protein